MFRRHLLSLFVLFLAPALLATPAFAQWPNNPDEDPLLAPPNDGSYIQRNTAGDIVGGEWNFWSFAPPNFTALRAEEKAIGLGMHADRAWQVTPGDSRIVVAVLDSGIKWDERDLAEQHVLNRAELEPIGATAQPLGPPQAGGDDWDINADGILTIADYVANDRDPQIARFDDNANGVLEGQDFIRKFSDGVDDDNNGYIDDISGWDCMVDDNDPYDDTRYGHGTGEARDSVGMGNNNMGSIGVCPGCSLLNLRTGDSFIADSNDLAQGILFAVDHGASVIQMAAGAINQTAYVHEAIEYAYANNVIVVASAADELSYHHNMPGTRNHTIYVHAVTHDESNLAASTTFLNFNNCTNYGAQLALSSPGESCSSEAVGVTSGHAGMIYSAAIGPKDHHIAGGLPPLEPPLTAEEVRQILIMSADDINIAGSENDPTKFPSGPGWDWHFGYGRNNVRSSVDMVVSREIPPEADLLSPMWFETLYPDQHPDIEITGRVGTRLDGRTPRYDSLDYRLEWAVGVDPKTGWTTIIEETGVAPKEGVLGHINFADIEAKIHIDAPAAADSHEDTITLRLVVSTVAPNGSPVVGEMRKAIFAHRDPDLFAGYPKWMGSSMESSAKFADLNADGKDELILCTADGVIHALQADGSELAGWPQKMAPRKGHDSAVAGNHEGACAFQAVGSKDTDCPITGQVTYDVRETPMATPAIGDLEGDGSSMEVVYASYDGTLQVFRADGTLMPGFPVRTNPEFSAVTTPEIVLDHGFFASPILFDLDGDGALEIIAAAMDQHLYVFDKDGSNHPGFPVLVQENDEQLYALKGARIVATPAVGDIDRDGQIEIIAATNEVYDDVYGRYYIISALGNNNPGGPYEGIPNVAHTMGELLPIVGSGVPSAPIIANTDTDPLLEFLVSGIAFRPIIRDWDGTNLVENVGMILGAEYGALSNSNDTGAYPLMSNGIFARLDETGEVAFIRGTAGLDFGLTFAMSEHSKRGYYDHQIMAWSATSGEAVIGFPQVVDDFQFIAGPSAADIDGDNSVEVLVGTGGYRVFAFNYKGEQPDGWPKFTGGWIITTPAVGDLDGDGLLELSVGTRNGWLYVWKTKGRVDGPIDWRNFGHDLRNTNNMEEPMLSAGGPVEPGEPNPEPVAEPSEDTTPDVVADAVVEADTATPPPLKGGNDGCCTVVTKKSQTLPPATLLFVGLFALLMRRRRQP